MADKQPREWEDGLPLRELLGKLRDRATLFATAVAVLAGLGLVALAVLVGLGFMVQAGWLEDPKHPRPTKCQLFAQRCVESKLFTLRECQRQAFEKYECMPEAGRK